LKEAHPDPLWERLAATLAPLELPGDSPQNPGGSAACASQFVEKVLARGSFDANCLSRKVSRSRAAGRNKLGKAHGVAFQKVVRTARILLREKDVRKLWGWRGKASDRMSMNTQERSFPT